jgi:hypothetical protein
MVGHDRRVSSRSLEIVTQSAHRITHSRRDTWHTEVLHLVTVLALYWLLAGVAVVALLNIAKWHVRRSSARQVALAGPHASVADEIDGRSDVSDTAEISRSIARHPAGGRRVGLAAGTG